MIMHTIYYAAMSWICLATAWSVICNRKAFHHRRTMRDVLYCTDPAGTSYNLAVERVDFRQHHKKLFWFKNPWVLYTIRK